MAYMVCPKLIRLFIVTILILFAVEEMYRGSATTSNTSKILTIYLAIRTLFALQQFDSRLT